MGEFQREKWEVLRDKEYKVCKVLCSRTTIAVEIVQIFLPAQHMFNKLETLNPNLTAYEYWIIDSFSIPAFSRGY